MSDSQAVLKAYQNNIFNVYHNRYVTEGKKICYKLKRELDKNVTLIWIPAHIGIQGNELADKLAKEAVDEDPHDSIEIPIRDLKREFKLETWNMTQESLVKDARIKGKAYFENFYNGKKKKMWFHKLNYLRYFITLINRLRTNHYNVNELLARKGIVESARCECGNEIESIEHVIWWCSRYDEAKARLDIELRKIGNTVEIDINKSIKEKDWFTLWCI